MTTPDPYSQAQFSKAERDAIVLGAGYMVMRPDGSIHHVHPSRILIIGSERNDDGDDLSVATDL